MSDSSGDNLFSTQKTQSHKITQDIMLCPGDDDDDDEEDSLRDSGSVCVCSSLFIYARFG